MKKFGTWEIETWTFKLESNNTKNLELVETMDEQQMINKLVSNFWMEEKESLSLKKIITQWEENNKFYILEAWSSFKLIKDWVETEIPLSKDSVMWESTLLQYLDGEKTSANASIEVKWKYYVVPFSKLKDKFKKLSNEDKNIITTFLEELENKRKWKTKPVT